MAKQRTAFICQSCEFQSPQWLGQCPNCGEWNTFVETEVTPTAGAGGGTFGTPGIAAKPIPIKSITSKQIARIKTGSVEFDRVLGGGFVPGQVVLLAGEPGIGKSTLITHIARLFHPGKVLYVCGEESAQQVKVRVERMGYKGDNLLVLPETDVDEIALAIEQEEGLTLAMVDSIQTLISQEYIGVPGSVGQVRGGTQKLTNSAKRTGVPVILVGHVTKEGTVAGPKVLEHIVDTVLYLEGDSQHMFRILRTTKNRFGPVSEVGIFEMSESGMVEVENPSEIFLSERSNSAGSCISVVMEGFRPILFEVQALTTPTAFGYPVRAASGFSMNRLKVLIAILEKHAKLDLRINDVYLNIAGGFKISEFSADLAVCLAIASSIKRKPIGKKFAAFGEVGLGGEIRKVAFMDKRIKEAHKLGYTSVVSPVDTRSLAEAIAKVL